MNTVASTPTADTRSAAGIEAVAALARAAMTTQILVQDGYPFLLRPGSDSPVPIERLCDEPRRIRASVELGDAASFVTYVKRARDDGSLVTAQASAAGGSFVAHLDYHFPKSDDGINNARWCEHVAVYPLAPSPEWVRWLGASGQMFSQTDFALFLEDNAADVVAPSGDKAAPNAAQLLELALTLQAKTNVQFSSGVRLDNGQHQITYNEVIDARAGAEGKLKIPAAFYLALAPFVGSDKYQVKARLRYRLERGVVGFRYEIERPHKIIENAFAEIRQSIAKELGSEVLLGKVASTNQSVK
ncbi:DUF2303 family protein [Nibricoccus sp. IMCC34717]|uniref:DUF2303 family protein n=1 Tax=Nibricoccus sp. IMCC34717 TaxID=3034021 RepID=UPI00384AE43A